MLRRLFPNIYEGWIVAGSSAFVLLMLSVSVFYGFGTLFNPMVDEFGWSVGATAFAFSVRSEVNGVAAPFVGAIVDRLGTQRVMLVGVTVIAAGIFLMSFQQTLWQFYLLMFMIAIGSSTSGGQVIMVSTVTWFERRRTVALSVATAGGALGGMLVWAVAALVEGLGWRGALRVIALVVLIVGMLAGSNVRTRPEDHHQPMDGDDEPGGASLGPRRAWGVAVRDAVRTRAFALIALTQATVFFALTAVIVHQIPYFETKGISTTLAGFATLFFSVSSVIGRIGAGVLADRYDKRYVLAAIVAVMSAGIPLLILVEEFWQGIVVMMLIGVGMGGANPLRTALMADYFGTTHFGAINGLAMFIGTIGAFFGPWLVGVGVDHSGEYTLGWLVSAGIAALAVPLILSARAPRELIESARRAAAPPPAGDRAPEAARPIVPAR